MSMRTEIAFVDSIIDDTVRILIGGKSTPAELPRTCLPAETREGDWLRVSFELLPEMREQRKKQVKKLLDDLANNPDISKSPQ